MATDASPTADDEEEEDEEEDEDDDDEEDEDELEHKKDLDTSDGNLIYYVQKYNNIKVEIFNYYL